MRNFKMLLQYEGTRYQGWQKQTGTDNTIQGKLETLLFKMTGKKTEVQGSGRTDAGVHALGQVANFHVNTKMGVDEMMEYMNFYVPDDIAVISLTEDPERIHSRLNDKGKTYCERVIHAGVPHVFDRRYAHMVEAELDIDRMKKGAEYLVGTHDFKAFTSNKRSKKSTVRTISEIRIERKVSASMGMLGEADEIRFLYSGNGFLYHMARIITGTLLEVGTHERKPEEVAEILRHGLREHAGELVPAKGLTLMEVRY